MFSPFVKKLMFARQFNMEDGKIEFLGDRELLLPVGLVTEFQAFDVDKTYIFAKKTCIAELARITARLGVKGPELVKNLTEIYEAFGLGRIEIKDFDVKNGRAIINIMDSPVARDYIRKNKSSKRETCNFIAGMLAGIGESIFGKSMEAKEVKCIAKGDNVCQFIVK
ncbi:MAG: 4-vinyl reductase [archaeon]